MTRTARVGGLLLAASAAMAMLGACTSSGGSSSSTANMAPDKAVPGHVAAAAPTKGSAVGSKQAPTASLVDSRALIRTASMTVDVRGSGNVAAKADAADDIAEAAGGEIDSDDRTTGRFASAALQLRVPPAALQRVLDELGKLGDEKSRRSSATDVTEQVADVASRVQSARAAISQLRALFDRAGKVADLLSVEDELTTREADLEALEAQQRTLARQTSLATVTLLLRTAAAHPAPKHPAKRTGFVGALQRGWDAFVAAAAWVAAAFATVLPFLVLLTLIALALRVVGIRLPTPRGRISG